MTVFKIGENALKIILTHTEVISCFGSYENLHGLSQDVKDSISALLRETVTDSGFFKKREKLYANIKIYKNYGCTIFLRSPNYYLSNLKPKTHIFDFKGSNELTDGILRLYNDKIFYSSQTQLYKMPYCYRLLIECTDSDALILTLSEYGHYKGCDNLLKAYTEEYGTLLIKENVILKYGSIFSK